MFYCKQCAFTLKWPESFSTSVGKCEMCGEQAECFDKPAKDLPDHRKEEYETIPNSQAKVGDEWSPAKGDWYPVEDESDLWFVKRYHKQCSVRRKKEATSSPSPSTPSTP